MHLRHIITTGLLVLACAAPLYAQSDVKADEFAAWQRTHGPRMEEDAQLWHERLDAYRANPPKPSVIPSTAGTKWLLAFAAAYRPAYRVRCTTHTSRSKGTYRTDTSCY